MRLIGAREGAPLLGQSPKQARIHYLHGADTRRWVCDVPTFGDVRYRNVYSGIDLVFHGDQRRLEYDFIVAPYADPTAITLDFMGARRIEIGEEGDLLLHLDQGILRQKRPILYQEIAGKRKTVAGRFVLHGANQVRFAVGAYDTTRPLVIDPVIWYSTYIGGSGADSINGVAVTSDGTTYLAGSASVADLPEPPGGPERPFAGGTDAFVMKLGATTSNDETPELLALTYIGGSALDEATAIGLDSEANVYLTGSTGSPDFPVVRAFQTGFGGGSAEFPSDAFVAKLNKNLTNIRYATYLGHSGDDLGFGIAVTPNGRAWTVGRTNSSSGIATSNAFQPAKAGSTDAFVALIATNNQGDAIREYVTYLGGSAFDTAQAVTLDTQGNAYLTGSTDSTNFPLTRTRPGAFQGNQSGTDAFVTKFAADPTVAPFPRYSTYLGGGGSDSGFAIAADENGTTYITGLTTSTDFPLKDPVDSTVSVQEAFVTRLNSGGSALLWSTYLGAGRGTGLGIALDSARNVWVTGRTVAVRGFPGQPQVPGNTFPRTDDNVFVTQFGYRFLFPSPASPIVPFIQSSTVFINAGQNDEGRSLVLDSFDRVYVGGTTASSNFDSIHPLQPAFGGQTDGFLIKFGAANLPPVVGSSTEKSLLRPFNQALMDVELEIQATDDSGEAPAVRVFVFSNEPASPGHLDATLEEDTLCLRAARDSHDQGRVYLIMVVGSDAEGAATLSCSTVVVPHDASPGALQAVQAEAAEVEAYCRTHLSPPPDYFPLIP